MNVLEPVYTFEMFLQNFFFNRPLFCSFTRVHNWSTSVPPFVQKNELCENRLTSRRHQRRSGSHEPPKQTPTAAPCGSERLVCRTPADHVCLPVFGDLTFDPNTCSLAGWSRPALPVRPHPPWLITESHQHHWKRVVPAAAATTEAPRRRLPD